jgi:type IV pilus assembly protein PilM
MFFIRKRQQKRDAALGLDLGSSQVKAAVVRRTTAGLELAEYARQPVTGNPGKANHAVQIGEAVQQLLNGLKTVDRRAYVSISCDSATVCQTEFPKMPLEEIRSALKLNSSKYLRRDFSNYCFDAVELAEPTVVDKNAPKINILVGGASKDEVASYREALVVAKVRPEILELAAISVVNAFGLITPDLVKDVVLLVDIGARSTTINFVRNGQPLITRIMHFGGDQISEYVAQILAIAPAEAEAQKLKMDEPVQELVKTALSPLAREVRSSIDFFERQHDCHISRLLACGGSACSPRLLELLAESVGIQVACWNPVDGLKTEHFNGERPALMAIGPSLAAAVGAAVARL